MLFRVNSFAPLVSRSRGSCDAKDNHETSLSTVGLFRSSPDLEVLASALPRSLIPCSPYLAIFFTRRRRPGDSRARGCWPDNLMRGRFKDSWGSREAAPGVANPHRPSSFTSCSWPRSEANHDGSSRLAAAIRLPDRVAPPRRSCPNPGRRRFGAPELYRGDLEPYQHRGEEQVVRGARQDEARRSD